MAVFIDLPEIRQRNRLGLSDWMEISALLDASDNSSSIEEMISLLKVSTDDKDLTDDSTDSVRTDVSAELLSRSKKLPMAYPFSFDGAVLKVKKPKKLDKQWAYIFCLFISYFGVNKGEKELSLWKQKNVTSLFEHISTIAAKNFLSSTEHQAEDLRFGFPRSSLDKKYKSFKAALQLLKSVVGEGTIIDDNPGHKNQKDAGLDIVAWRNFPDGKTNKLLFLGQCAAGNDFKEKSSDIQKIERFFTFKTNPIKGFFIPHELDDDVWGELSCDTHIGIIFDRSRIASYSKNWDGQGFSNKFELMKKKLRKGAK